LERDSDVLPSFDVPASLADARAIQERLQARVIQEGAPDWSLIGGADVSEKGDRARAAFVVLDRQLRVVEEAVAETGVPFPYIPGFLSFREIPSLLEAWAKLKNRPDLVIVDGQGRAHPRRLGIACHLGVTIDVPTIGCAKKRLVGAYEEPDDVRGARSPLLHRGEVIGSVLRTRPGTRPVFVSLGHRISLAAAVETVLACAPRFKLPEPQRLADRLSKKAWTSSASSS
jgi:deoxyribonuclease V